MARTFAWNIKADLFGLAGLVPTDDSNFEVINPDQIDASGIAPRAIVNRAIVNTRALLQPEEMVCVHFEQGSIGKIDGRTPFESSRLANHGWWEKVARKVHGSLLVAAPDWRIVLYADSAHEGSYKVLSTVAGRIASAGNPTALSASILQWRPDGWELA